VEGEGGELEQAAIGPERNMARQVAAHERRPTIEALGQRRRAASTTVAEMAMA
jgi:hypothetical protein